MTGPCLPQVAVCIRRGRHWLWVFLKTKMSEQKRAGEMVEVPPIQRYKAHVAPEDGSLTCLEAGVCKSLAFTGVSFLLRAEK